jgi:hypothetical protein
VCEGGRCIIFFTLPKFHWRRKQKNLHPNGKNDQTCDWHPEREIKDGKK